MLKLIQSCARSLLFTLILILICENGYASELWEFTVSIGTRTGFLEKASFPQVDVRLGAFRRVSEAWSLGVQSSSGLWKGNRDVKNGFLCALMGRGQQNYFRFGVGPIWSGIHGSGTIASLEYGVAIVAKTPGGRDIPFRGGFVYSPIFFRDTTYTKWTALTLLFEFVF